MMRSEKLGGDVVANTVSSQEGVMTCSEGGRVHRVCESLFERDSYCEVQAMLAEATVHVWHHTLHQHLREKWKFKSRTMNAKFRGIKIFKLGEVAIAMEQSCRRCQGTQP
jgi:hypothetical protein